MDLLKYEGHEDYWGLEDFCEMRLRELMLFKLEKRLHGKFTAVHKGGLQEKKKRDLLSGSEGIHKEQRF